MKKLITPKDLVDETLGNIKYWQRMSHYHLDAEISEGANSYHKHQIVTARDMYNPDNRPVDEEDRPWSFRIEPNLNAIHNDAIGFVVFIPAKTFQGPTWFGGEHKLLLSFEYENSQRLCKTAEKQGIYQEANDGEMEGEEYAEEKNPFNSVASALADACIYLGATAEMQTLRFKESQSMDYNYKNVYQQTAVSYFWSQLMAFDKKPEFWTRLIETEKLSKR